MTVQPSSPISPEPQKTSSETKPKIKTDEISKAIDTSTKLEVLKMMNALAKGERPTTEESTPLEKAPAEMKISNAPLNAETRTDHLASIENAIKWLESECSNAFSSGHCQENLVQLEYALERAQSTRGHLIQMERKPEHEATARQGLEYLAKFKLES